MINPSDVLMEGKSILPMDSHLSLAKEFWMSSPMIQDSCSIPDSTDKRGSLRSLKNLIQVQIPIQNLIFYI